MSHDEIIVNCDPCFDINTASRAITNSTGKVNLIQNDHNSERFGFKMPRFVEGHDMSLCDRVEVHYINEDKTTKETIKDADIITDVRVTEDEESIEFSWLISQGATQLVGALAFSIKFSCFDEETNKPVYVWNTAIFSGISILPSMDNMDIILEENPDYLESMKQELTSHIDEQVAGTDLSHPYRKIAECVVGEDGVTKFEIEKDLDGNTFKLDGVVAEIYSPEPITTSKSWTCYVNAVKSGSSLFYFTDINASSNGGAEAGSKRMKVRAERLDNGNWWSMRWRKWNSGTIGATYESTYALSPVNYMNKFIIGLGEAPVGTTVTFYGREATTR